MGENIVDGGDGRAAGSRPPSRIHATGPVPLSPDHAKPTPMPGRYVSLGDARCLHCHVDQKKNTTGIRGLIRAPVPLPAPPERVGGISGFSHCVSGRSLVWVGRGFVCAKLFVGAAFCWRGFVLTTGGTMGIKTKSEQCRCPLAWRDPWRAANPAQTLSSRRKTFSVSLQRMTCGPLRGRPSLSLPMRERTWFWRLAKHRPLRLSPS